MCLIYFAKNLDVNEYFDLKILNQLKKKCYERAKEIKARLSSTSLSLPSTPRQPEQSFLSSRSGSQSDLPGESPFESKYFSLNRNDFQNKSSEFDVDLDKIFKVSFVTNGPVEANKPKKKKSHGALWYKNQKKIETEMSLSVKKLKNARTCANQKMPHYAYKVLCELYRDLVNTLE